jgi:hypothetical protein
MSEKIEIDISKNVFTGPPPVIPAGQGDVEWVDMSHSTPDCFEMPAMTLLDVLAGHVISGIYANPAKTLNTENVGMWAEFAYAQAQAMMRARARANCK